jgi:hypothetical protein
MSTASLLGLRRTSMISLGWITALTLLASVQIASSDVPKRIACIADDVYFVWYREGLGMGLAASPAAIDPNQKLAGYRATQPETRMRFTEGKLFISDGTRAEYYYADLEAHGFWRYVASEYTLMFSDDYKTLIAVNSTKTATSVTSLKCISG